MKGEPQTKTEREYVRDMNAPVNAFDILQMLGSVPLSALIFMFEISAIILPPWWVSLLIIAFIAFLSYILIIKYNSRNVASHILVALVVSIISSFIVGIFFFGVNWSTFEISLTAINFNYIAFTILPAFGLALGLDVLGK